MILRFLILTLVIAVISGCEDKEHNSATHTETARDEAPQPPERDDALDEEENRFIIELSEQDVQRSNFQLRQMECLELLERETSLRHACAKIASDGFNLHFKEEEKYKRAQLIKLLKGEPTDPELICGNTPIIREIPRHNNNQKAYESQLSLVADLSGGHSINSAYTKSVKPYIPEIAVSESDRQWMRNEWKALMESIAEHKKRWDH